VSDGAVAIGRDRGSGVMSYADSTPATVIGNRVTRLPVAAWMALARARTTGWAIRPTRERKAQGVMALNHCNGREWHAADSPGRANSDHIWVGRNMG
jgi:hypothetical protein